MRSDTYHRGKYYVTFKRGFEDYKKDITISIDKVFDNDSLRIILSDDEDPNFLCILNVTRCDYEELKKQQGLLIDFDNFPSQLVRLLQQCASNNMFLIMQQTNPVQFFFEVVEHNEFRRLVHLSLKTGPATDMEIKKHMADNILNLKKTLSNVKTSLSSSEVMWNDKCIAMERKIHDLTLTVSKMEEEKLRKETEFQEALRHEKDKLNQEKNKWQRSSELNTQAQVATVQENLQRKDKQLEELNSLTKTLKDNIKLLENQLGDKCQRISVLEKEVQKTHIELATTSAKCASLDRELMDREKNLHNFTMRCSDMEKTLRCNEETLKELRHSLQITKQEKTNLEERLALSESRANKTTEAANSTTEQLLKANQIISKQNADIVEMKEKILCRTAIALEQEKVIERNAKEVDDLKTELSNAKEDINKLKLELDNFKHKYEECEKTLKDKEDIIKNNNMVIQWLHKKMEDNCDSGVQSKARLGTAASSTPYFMQSKNTSETDCHAQSDDTINFYATSKSIVEDSPEVISTTKGRRTGLDPKYLAPAVEETSAKTKASDRRSYGDKSVPQSHRDKENVTTNLPKVDYREKKNGKSTFRSTPVSAYFP